MQFLKGLALSLLSFLLFLSLSIFSMVFMLNNTLLNPDFLASEVNRLDISSLATELLTEQMPPDQPYVAEVLNETITDLEPWIKEQASVTIYSSHDYLMGKTESLSLVISMEPVRNTLKENLREALLASPPPELTGLPPAMVEQYFDDFYQQFAELIPTTFEFSEDSLPPEVLALLEQVRYYASYSQLGYWALIGFMVLLILGIFLIDRQIRGTTRRLGIPFLTYGAIGYGSIFATKYFSETWMSQLLPPDIPPSLQTWVTEFLNDLTAPMGTFSLGLLIAGVVLLVVSFVYKPREPSS